MAPFAILGGLCVSFGWLQYEVQKAVERTACIEKLQGAVLRTDKTRLLSRLPDPYNLIWERVIWVDFSNRGEELFPPLPGVVTDQDLAFVATFHDIEWLGLANNRISDIGLKYIAGMHALKRLSLAFTDVTDDGMVSLSHMDLTVLDMAHTQITDRSMHVIASLSHLEDLSIRGTRVTDAGLAQLTKLTCLCVLDVSGTKTTDAGIAKLEERFKSLCVIR